MLAAQCIPLINPTRLRRPQEKKSNFLHTTRTNGIRRSSRLVAVDCEKRRSETRGGGGEVGEVPGWGRWSRRFGIQDSRGCGEVTDLRKEVMGHENCSWGGHWRRRATGAKCAGSIKQWARSGVALIRGDRAA